MNASYLTLFTLEVTHQYYGGEGAPCPDFEFVIAEHTRREMAGAHMLASMQGNRLHVLYEAGEPKQEADESKPAKEPPPPRQEEAVRDMELVIGLRLRNPSFEYFTDAIPAPIPLYTNTDTSWKNTNTTGKLNGPQTSDLVAHRYAPVQDEKPALSLDISRMRGNTPVWQYEKRAGEAAPSIDMRFCPPGCYVYTARESGGKIARKPLIVAPDLAEVGMWGVARIAVTQSFWDSSKAPDFHIDFNAVEETLDYYIIAPKDWKQAFDDLSIKDTTQQDSKLTFEPITESSNNVIPASLLGAPDKSSVLLLRSTHTVPRRLVSSLRLQLNLNGKTLINNLPLPGANMLSAKSSSPYENQRLARFIVHISKPS